MKTPIPSQITPNQMLDENSEITEKSNRK